MANNFDGKFLASVRRQIIGDTVLIEEGDRYEIVGSGDTKATIVFSQDNLGHFKNSDRGEIYFAQGASEAIGQLYAPKPTAAAAPPEEYVKYTLRLRVSGARGERKLRIFAMSVGNNSEELAEEDDGEEITP